MRVRIISLDEFGCLYKSLALFIGMPMEDALHMTYTLNTANIDTARGYGKKDIIESDKRRFCRLIQLRGYPYQSATKLMVALETLESNIRASFLTNEQKSAMRKLRQIQNSIIYLYQSAYGFDVADVRRSTYGDCRKDLYTYPYEPIWEVRHGASLA